MQRLKFEQDQEFARQTDNFLDERAQRKTDLELFKGKSENFGEVEADFNTFEDAARAMVERDGKIDPTALAQQLRRDPEKVNNFIKGEFGNEIQFAGGFLDEASQKFE